MTACALDPDAERIALVGAGIAHHRAGRLEAAVAAYEAAHRLDPADGQLLILLGIATQQRGRLEEAEAFLEEAVRLLPDVADGYRQLGGVRRALGKLAAAEEAGRRAVALDDADVGNHLELAETLARAGAWGEVIAVAGRAARLAPDRAEAARLLAKGLRECRHFAQAAVAYRAVLAREPECLSSLNDLGVVLHQLKDFPGATRCFTQALDLKPDFADALSNLGMMLVLEGEAETALLLHERAVSLLPDSASIAFNHANCLDMLDRWPEAEAAFARALALRPHFPIATWNRSLMRAGAGALDAAWGGFEARWDIPDFPSHRWSFDEPQWRGEPLDGRTLLLHAEQGLGDTLQLVRYVPLLRERGARIVLECQASLVPLLRGIDGIDQVVAFGQPLPPFDCHLPMFSLLSVFATTEATIPPLLPALPGLRGPARPGGPLRVGLVWAGNPTHGNDSRRSIPFARFRQLLEVPDVTYVGLQVGAAAADAAGSGIEDAGAGFRDFTDTAAVVAGLDLVVTVDTAVAHLAGSLGVPTFVLLPRRADWRWMRDRRDSPWYPAMTLFRQRAEGAWDEPLAEVRAHLAELGQRATAATAA